MRHRERVIGVAVILAALLTVKLGSRVYSWYAHDEERTEIARLSTELEEVGMAIVWSQVAADSLHAEIEVLDADLETMRSRVESYGRRSVDGVLPGPIYDGYRRELDAYNRRVGERNARYERWREVIDRNHVAVDRFNALAERIGDLAAAMGEPYYSIPTPAEIAVERGIVAGGVR